MEPRESSAEIDDVAAAWVAREDRGELSANEAADLEAWLSGDSRRMGAYARNRAVMAHLDRAQALGPRYGIANFVPPAAKAQPSLTRRNFATYGGALAASVVAAAGLGVGWSARSEEITTRRGEVRRVPLADGTVVTLNTASKITMRRVSSHRAVTLVAGEATFDVARDPGAPFVVDAGDCLVRVLGTSFTIRRLDGQPIEVLVREGVVDIVRNGDEGPGGSIRAGARQRVVASATGPLTAEPITAEALERELAWRDGLLSFYSTDLAAAAATFARYSDPRIVIDDAATARQTVTGVYQANDPKGFARAVATSLNLSSYSSGDAIHLRR